MGLEPWSALEMSIRIDEIVRQVRPDNWRSHKPRENVIKSALLPIFGNDEDAVERVFLIINSQREY